LGVPPGRHRVSALDKTWNLDLMTVESDGEACPSMRGNVSRSLNAVPSEVIKYGVKEIE
jgi:hypothetical protein